MELFLFDHSFLSSCKFSRHPNGIILILDVGSDSKKCFLSLRFYKFGISKKAGVVGKLKLLKLALTSVRFLTASNYCGSGLKIDLVVVCVVIVVVVIKLLSNSTAFNAIKIFRIM